MQLPNEATKFRLKVVQKMALSSKNQKDLDLLEIARGKDLRTIHRLVDDGAYVNVKDPSTGDTPLIIAVKSRNVEIARFLLENSADVNAVDARGRTALWWAFPLPGEITLCRWLPILQVLFEFGADPNKSVVEGESLLMHFIAMTATPEIIRYLIQQGADVNYVNEFGESALSLAISLGLLEIKKILIEAETAGT